MWEVNRKSVRPGKQFENPIKLFIDPKHSGLNFGLAELEIRRSMEAWGCHMIINGFLRFVRLLAK